MITKNLKSSIYDPESSDRRAVKSMTHGLFVLLSAVTVFVSITSIFYSSWSLSSVEKDTKLENPLILTFGQSDPYWYFYAIPAGLLLIIALFKKDNYTIRFSIGLLILVGLFTYYTPSFLAKFAPDSTATSFGRVQENGNGVNIVFENEVVSLPAVESQNDEGRRIFTVPMSEDDYEFLKKVEAYKKAAPKRN